jgi:hypothetical protein
MLFTECMTGVELRYSVLTQFMSVPSQTGNLIRFREGVEIIYTVEGKGNTPAKIVTRGDRSEFQGAA